WLVDNSKGYVGADIEGVCREAGMIAIRENLKAKHVEKAHFEAAFKIVRPSATEETIKYYEAIRAALESGLTEKKKEWLGYYA
ncbi:MAG: hypothetical protein KAX31_04800, partial [Thermoplasmata archaeon]|nr:hypothetical protein [Thermoplasmata archaeon]